MSQPVLLRTSVSITLVRALQLAFPALIVPLMLKVAATLMRVPFDHQLVSLATLAAVTSLVTFRRPTDETLRPDIRSSEVIIEALFRSALTFALLFLIHLVTEFGDEINRPLLVLWVGLSAAAIASGQILLLLAERSAVLSRENLRSAVVLGVNTGSLLLVNRLKQRPEYLTRVVGFFDDRSAERLEPTNGLPILGRLTDLVPYVKREEIDVIFISLPIRHIDRVMAMLDDLRDSTASIYYLPDVFAFDLIQSRSWEVDGVPIIAMCETPFFGYRGVVKRMTDIGFTLLILAFALPVMMAIALAIRLTSKGPAIFKQRRYGLDGEEIVVYKFRSMQVMEDGDQVRQASRDDSRVTRVGAFLRRTSLDELPQLFNVLQGRMSLVGPRPHAVAHNELYRKLIKGYMMRHKVLPGITGLAQINGCRGETSQLEQMQARVNYDLDYLRQWSPSLDLRILVRTALQVILGDKQAY